MTTYPTTSPHTDSARKEIPVLGIELLARDLRASSLSHAERRNRRAAFAADIGANRPRRPGGARRAIGTYLVHLGTAIAGPSADGRSPRPLDRPA